MVSVETITEVTVAMTVLVTWTVSVEHVTVVGTVEEDVVDVVDVAGAADVVDVAGAADVVDVVGAADVVGATDVVDVGTAADVVGAADVSTLAHTSVAN